MTGPGNQHKTGIRTIAVIELAKGMAVATVVLVFVQLMQGDATLKASGILDFFNISENSWVGVQLLRIVEAVKNSNWLVWAALGVLYVVIRFIESYGLWRLRRWAEWLGAVSGGIYIPFEIVAVLVDFAWWELAILVVNVCIVAYLVMVLMEEGNPVARNGGMPATANR